MRTAAISVFVIALLSPLQRGIAQPADYTDELTSRELIAYEQLQGGGEREWRTVILVVLNDRQSLSFRRAPRDGDAARLNEFQKLATVFFSSPVDFPEEEFRHLAGAKIPGIAIWNRSLTDQGLRLLRNVEGLRTLSLQGHYKTPETIQLTAEGLRSLREYEALTELKLSRVHITDECLEEIAKLNQLTQLYLFHCPKITDAGVSHLSSLTKLEKLALSNAAEPLTSGSLAYIKPLSNLTQLGIGWMDVEKKDLEHLQAFHQLESLALDATNLTDAGLAKLTALQSLKSLSITRTQITDAGLATLGAMQQLEALNLEGNGITAAGLASLADLPNLKELDFSNTSVTDAGLAHLANRNWLRTLRMSRTKVGDAGVSELRNLTELQWLDLSDTNVSDQGLAELRNLKQLEWLLLHNTIVSDLSLEVLYELPRLRHLTLRGTKVSAEGVSELRRRLPDCYVGH